MNVILILCDTLRRDHVGAYTGGKPLNECWSREAPDWSVPTPNMDRLAERGVTFDHCWCGSTPCMPARRDIYTGRYDFLWRGWGPLEEDDKDLPRQISGEPNESIQKMTREGRKVSYLVTDHFHLWEQGSGNYHMGYTGFEFIRGMEADAWHTAPVDFPCPERDRMGKVERHWRNVHFTRKTEDDYFSARTIDHACAWLEQNRAHRDFYLHLDIFDPHEPWDPPEDILKMFDPRGYSVPGMSSGAPYAKWRDLIDEGQMTAYRARYAAKVAFLDQRLGRLFDTIERQGLWDDTLVILTTDHGTYNGDHGRTGKIQTHEHDAVGHIPFVAAYPQASLRGTRRSQLVQLVDLYPTVLSAVDRPCPEDIHGVDLIPVLEDNAPTRDCALAGQFGKSVTLTDGEWILHQSPVEGNQPLNWYGHCLSKFAKGYKLGPFENGCRPCECSAWDTPTWLSDKRADPNELVNLADCEPAKLAELQRKLKAKLKEIGAPAEQFERLGLQEV